MAPGELDGLISLHMGPRTPSLHRSTRTRRRPGTSRQRRSDLLVVLAGGGGERTGWSTGGTVLMGGSFNDLEGQTRSILFGDSGTK